MSRLLERIVMSCFDRARAVIALCAIVTAIAVIASLRVQVDTDPENMLEPTQPDRVAYDRMKAEFGLHDLIVVGIVDDRGVFRPDALARIAQATDSVLQVPGVMNEDVVSLVSTDDARAVDGLVDIRPVMDRVPANDAEVASLRRAIAENPFLDQKLASRDGRAVALYVPIESKDRSFAVAREIRGILGRLLLPGERVYLAGLPVAEDTFGHEMFVQMAVVAPLAFAGILLLVWILFRDPSFLVPVALLAALSVVWSMGALIGTGHTVHIMSSMIPVFLMPIAILDSIHILSEIAERRGGGASRRDLLREAMRPLYRPMAYTSLTSAVGFASLGLAFIPPVRVFGLFVAFGIGVAWLLTHTFFPALFAVLPIESGRAPAVATPPAGAAPPAGASMPPRAGMAAALGAIGRVSFRRAPVVLAVTALLLAAGAAGIARLRSDDNPVRWFRPGHPMRVAHDELNARFGGTYMANVVVTGAAEGAARRPEVMSWIARLEERLESDPAVGKVSSVADIVSRINRVLHGDDPAHDRVPADAGAIGQMLFLFQGSGNPDDLDHLLAPGGREANLWVQLKDGDNHAMERVEALTARFARSDPPPPGVSYFWSGLNHINVVWQRLMVRGMLQAILGSFLVVFALMALEFRSWRLGLLAMLPLTVAIVVAYGAIGLAGKSYDMPIAVCSSLSLGLAVDFAIHFLERFRARWRVSGDLEDANGHVFGAPGIAIMRNAVVISLGFLPLIASTLTPYVTVGIFFAALMVAGALATLFVLPAALRLAGAGALR